jgi:hypothetical protein
VLLLALLRLLLLRWLLQWLLLLLLLLWLPRPAVVPALASRLGTHARRRPHGRTGGLAKASAAKENKRLHWCYCVEAGASRVCDDSPFANVGGDQQQSDNEGCAYDECEKYGARGNQEQTRRAKPKFAEG